MEVKVAGKNREIVVTELKRLVDSGQFKVGMVIKSSDIYEHTPSVFRTSAGVIISWIQQAGLLKKLGQGNYEIMEELRDTPLADCIELVEAAEKGRVKRKYTKRAQVEVESPMPVVTEMAMVNLGDVFSVLDLDEKVAARRQLDDMIEADIAIRMAQFANADKDIDLAIERADREKLALQEIISGLRSELRTVKESKMELQEEFNKLMRTPKHEIAERKVPVATKPIPEGMQSGGSGNIPGSFVVHRKPLMGHTPRIIREHKVKE